MGKRADVWSSPRSRRLASALAMLSDQATMEAFLRDLMTEKEILELGARLEAAQMLHDGQTYSSITAATGLSSRTVARISTWLNEGGGGYAAVLEMLADEQ